MKDTDVLSLVGEFTWGFGQEFFIETAVGNFIWKSPSFRGDNSITPTDLSRKQWFKGLKIPYGRSKGNHIVGEYCKGATMKDKE